jgi:hypothetical protein
MNNLNKSLDPVPQKVLPQEKLLQYNISTQVYNGPLQVPAMDFCNGFTVKNVGTATLIVMGDSLAPGEFKAFGGNRGEIFIGRIDIKFTGSGTTLALVTQKYYMNIPFANQSL